MRVGQFVAVCDSDFYRVYMKAGGRNPYGTFDYLATTIPPTIPLADKYYKHL